MSGDEFTSPDRRRNLGRHFPRPPRQADEKQSVRWFPEPVKGDKHSLEPLSAEEFSQLQVTKYSGRHTHWSIRSNCESVQGKGNQNAL